MVRTRGPTNIQRAGGALRRHTSGSFSVSTVWRNVQEDAGAFNEPLGKNSQTWVVETIHLMEYHGLLELRDSGKLRMVPGLRTIVKQAQDRTKEKRFITDRAEHDFLRKEILKCVGRLRPIRKRELHREHMALQKQVKDGTLSSSTHRTKVHKSTSTTSALHMEASTSTTGVFVNGPKHLTTPVRRNRSIHGDDHISQEAYPTPVSELRRSLSRLTPNMPPPTPESPTPMATIDSYDDNSIDDRESGDIGNFEPISGRTWFGYGSSNDASRGKDAEIAALKANSAGFTDALCKVTAERDEWKLKLDELGNERHTRQLTLRLAESELRNKEEIISELQKRLHEAERRLAGIARAASASLSTQCPIM